MRLPSFSLREPWRAWTAMLASVVDKGKPLHPAVEAICMRRVMRSFWTADRKECLEVLGKQGRPTARLLKLLVRVFISMDKEIVFRARDALCDLTRRAPKLCKLLVKRLGGRHRRGAYPMYYPRDYEIRVLEDCRKGK